MAPGDVAAAHAATVAAFEDLARRHAKPVPPRPDEAAAHRRLRHLLATDPGGCFVAERGGAVVGVAVALLREGLYGLSLLVVRPEAQSTGLGSALLAATLAYGDGARGGIILSSDDPRALRAYARAGFALHPALQASGAPRLAPDAVDGTRPGDLADLPATEEIDRAVRGAAHGADLAVLLDDPTARLLLTEDERGYAVVRDGSLRLLAARGPASARAVLRAALASAAPGQEAGVEWLTAVQGCWAMDVVLDAGLELSCGGVVCVRGDVGPLWPYLPNGAYL
jgi:GNAT superfamily N-acetyltransferase